MGWGSQFLVCLIFFFLVRMCCTMFTTDLGHSHSTKCKIFLNESLTPRSRFLFHEVCKFQKSNHYKSCWTQNGQVYLKKDSKSHKICLIKIFTVLHLGSKIWNSFPSSIINYPTLSSFKKKFHCHS